MQTCHLRVPLQMEVNNSCHAADNDLKKGVFSMKGTDKEKYFFAERTWNRMQKALSSRLNCVSNQLPHNFSGYNDFVRSRNGVNKQVSKVPSTIKSSGPIFFLEIFNHPVIHSHSN